MATQHPHITHLLQCIDLEEKEQIQRYSLDQQHSLKALKAEGLALHPISIIRKNFGYADYPEISFKLNFPTETGLFKDGVAVECFCYNQEPIKGIMMQMDGKMGECRLFAPDFPDWIEDDGVGLKLAPDQRTTTVMKTVLKNIEHNKNQSNLFNTLHPINATIATNKLINTSIPLQFKNQHLNKSQQDVIEAIVNNEFITILHGPPGTGKTTTLIEGILQLIKLGQKILVSAPSNAAVDNITKGLIINGVNILRVGNSSKVDEAIFNHTPEGKLQNSKQQKEIKQLKIRAEEFRKMALKYKRSFGRDEREQRNLLFKEVKQLRTEIKKIQAYNEEKLYTDASVIAGTPIGLYDAALHKHTFNTLIMDEAGQCIEPLAWCIFPLAQTYVLAGDHLQLPPTVLSNQAALIGYNKSILEVSIHSIPSVYLLNIQYRMRAAIAGFSSNYFYNGLLQTAPNLINNSPTHVTFIDTAGSGFNEENGKDGTSLQNEGELRIVQHLLKNETFKLADVAFISPYAGQIALAKEMLPQLVKLSTIDSFQGQEKHTIILSLVRSNDEGIIGFLKDYRRMNVAITRAKEQLIVIGDSATIGADNFYSHFLQYIEEQGSYKSVWEFEL
jgi:ATP-dependent RNA/DNA helicase IGHMBP2